MSDRSGVLRIETAEVFEPLLHPSRYKGAHGGRGSGKSHFFADLAVETCLMRPGIRGVCIREIQKDLAHSAKQLIEDKIKLHGLGGYFNPLQREIGTPGGGVIIFQGMQDHTAESVKSLEGFDFAWCEEAHAISQRSLRLLRPTLRKPGSELWFSWNPRHRRDAVDELLRAKRPDDAVVVQANWRDNPWFTPELEVERQLDLKQYPEQYGHVWEGEYQTVVEGAYWARELELAERMGRICDVEIEPSLPVHTAWDLGIGDSTAIWFFQVTANEIRVVDHYENHSEGLTHYADVLAKKGYRYGDDFVPHDAKVRELGTGRTRIEIMMELGRKPKLVPHHKVDDGIEAARQTLAMCWFDRTRCDQGLDALRQYRTDFDDRADRMVFANKPLHDWTSHSADAFRYLAMAWREMAQPPARPEPERRLIVNPAPGQQSTATFNDVVGKLGTRRSGEDRI